MSSSWETSNNFHCEISNRLESETFTQEITCLKPGAGLGRIQMGTTHHLCVRNAIFSPSWTFQHKSELRHPPVSKILSSSRLFCACVLQHSLALSTWSPCHGYRKVLTHLDVSQDAYWKAGHVLYKSSLSTEFRYFI